MAADPLGLHTYQVIINNTLALETQKALHASEGGFKTRLLENGVWLPGSAVFNTPLGILRELQEGEVSAGSPRSEPGPDLHPHLS